MTAMLADAAWVWLISLGFLAGMMDAAVGGGGLVQIPALFNTLPASTPLPQIMAVNKFASCNGTFWATVQFVRKIKVPWRMLLPAAALAFVSAYLGSKLVAHVPAAWFKPFVFAVLIGMAVYTFRKKELGQTVREHALTRQEQGMGWLMGAAIGFYDGLIGPGTGSFLSFLFVRVYGFDFLTAIASAKVINLTTNLAALSFFIPHGHVVWAWALPLALANVSGSLIGSRLAIRGGSHWLRRGFICLLCVLISKFGWDIFFS